MCGYRDKVTYCTIEISKESSDFVTANFCAHALCTCILVNSTPEWLSKCKDKPSQCVNKSVCRITLANGGDVRP
jgi:hypothetical protein